MELSNIKIFYITAALIEIMLFVAGELRAVLISAVGFAFIFAIFHESEMRQILLYFRNSRQIVPKINNGADSVDSERLENDKKNGRQVKQKPNSDFIGGEIGIILDRPVM